MKILTSLAAVASVALLGIASAQSFDDANNPSNSPSAVCTTGNVDSPACYQQAGNLPALSDTNPRLDRYREKITFCVYKGDENVGCNVNVEICKAAAEQLGSGHKCEGVVIQ